jgi:hypothetical protein
MKHPIFSRGVMVGLLLSVAMGVAQTVSFDPELGKKAAAAEAVVAPPSAELSAALAAPVATKPSTTRDARTAETVLVKGPDSSPLLTEAAGVAAKAKQDRSGIFAAPIPEPGVYASLLGLAVLGVAGVRRWTRRPTASN